MREQIDFFGLPPRQDWMVGASCIDAEDVDLWFPSRGGSTKKAKAICSQCIVQKQCLEFAMEWELEGIWGGTGTKERKAMARRAA